MNEITTAQGMMVLLNGMAQSLVVVLAVAVLVRWLQGSAATRYALWYVALISLVALPALQYGHQQSAEQQDIASTYVVEETRHQTLVLPEHAGVEGAVHRVFEEQVHSEQVITPLAPSNRESAWIQLAEGRWVSVLWGLWALGALIMGGRLMWSAWHIYRLRRAAQDVSPATAKRFAGILKRHKQGTVAMRTSAAITIPQVVGIWRPVILLPEALLDHLEDAEWEQVLLHEIAHIERYDQWTLLGQRLIEMIMWFNPLTWWVGFQLALERELACDDWAIRSSGQAKRYAWCLTKLVEWGLMPRSSPLMSSTFLRRNTLEERIAHVLRKRTPSNAVGRMIQGGLAIVLLGGVLGLVGRVPQVFAVAPGIPASTVVDIEIPDTPAGRLLQQVLQEDVTQQLYKLDAADSDALVAYALNMQTGARLEWHVEAGEDADGRVQYQNVNVIAIADTAQP